MSLLRTSAWAAFGAILVSSSRFALGAILARKLAPEAFGQVAYGQWLVDLGFLLCSLGVPGAASRYLAEYRHTPGMVASFARRWQPFAFGLPILASCAAIFGAWLSGMGLSEIGLVSLAAWALFNGVWAMQTAALIGLQRFDLVFLSNTVFAAITLGGIAFIPSNDPGFIFGLMGIGSVCSLLVGMSETRGLARVGTDSEVSLPWRGIATYALNIWISTLLASLVWSRGELPVVRAILGDVAVAHYAAALTIFGGAIQGVMLVVSGVAPHLTRLWGEGSREAAIRLARSIMDMQLLVAATGSLFVVFYGEQVVAAVFTEAYRDAAGPLSILCLGLIAFVVSSQTQLLQLETDARFNRDTIIVGLVILYVAAALLVAPFQLMGAAVARAGAMLAMGGVTILFCVKRWGWRSVAGRNILIMIGVMSLAIWVEQAPLISSPLPRFATFSLAVVMIAVSMRNQEKGVVVVAVAAQVLAKWRHRRRIGSV